MIRKALKLLKYMILGIITMLLILGIVGFIFMNTSPQFGGTPSEESLVRIQNSPNYEAQSFKNLEHTLASTGFKWRSIPEFFTSGNGKTPTKALPQEQLSSDFFEMKNSATRVTWFGHSALFVALNNLNVFIDPMLGNVPAPHPWLGSARFNKELPISISELPQIDVVLISHDHYDHLDYESIVKLKDKVQRFLVPLGIKAHLVSWGIPEVRIQEFDWWEGVHIEGVEFVATPARHFSGRGLTRNNTLWCSWVIRSQDSNLFFSGDSGYGEHFKAIGEAYGPFDFAMMECGQYNEQWSHIHMMPEETIQASKDVNAKAMMPIHWGAFKLALHTWDDPVIRASKTAKQQAVHMVTPKIGASILIDDIIESTSDWWKLVD